MTQFATQNPIRPCITGCGLSHTPHTECDAYLLLGFASVDYLDDPHAVSVSTTRTAHPDDGLHAHINPAATTPGSTLDLSFPPAQATVLIGLLTAAVAEADRHAAHDHTTLTARHTN